MWMSYQSTRSTSGILNDLFQKASEGNRTEARGSAPCPPSEASWIPDRQARWDRYTDQRSLPSSPHLVEVVGTETCTIHGLRTNAHVARSYIVSDQNCCAGTFFGTRSTYVLPASIGRPSVAAVAAK
jgi:hypothetical protein